MYLLTRKRRCKKEGRQNHPKIMLVFDFTAGTGRKDEKNRSYDVEEEKDGEACMLIYL
jgi:hypothetical protein